MQNSMEIEKKHKKIKKFSKEIKKNNSFILIDLSKYNVENIANVLFGFAVYCLLVQMGYSWESFVAVNAFKYLERL